MSAFLMLILPVLFVGAIVSTCLEEPCNSDKMIKDAKKAILPTSFVWRSGDGDEEDPKIARLYLSGIIEDKAEEGFSLFLPSHQRTEHPLITKIKAVTENPAFDGIWLEIDSPGGSVSLSDEIYHNLCKFRESAEGRFVFVYFKSQACSGGYYVAVAADRIMAGPAAWTGSIGVIVSGYNISKLADTIGVKSLNIVSSKNKALLDPMKPVDTNHLAIVQRIVDQTYENFLSLVSERRGIAQNILRSVADGRILSAQDALELKLIDAIGYEEDAIEELMKLSLGRKPQARALRVYTVDLEDLSFGLPVLSADWLQGLFSRAFFDSFFQSWMRLTARPDFR